MPRIKIPYIIVPILCFILVLAALAAEFEQYAGQVIKEVRFVGIKSFEPSMFLYKISTNVGDRLSYEQLSLDIKRLFQEDIFEDIAVDVDKEADGLVITFNVTEKPTIMAITITGNDRLSQDKIREKIVLEEFSIYSRKKVSESVRAIKALYEEEGYTFTQVSIDEKLTTNDRIEINFSIDEGAKLRVTEIEFRGNKAVSSWKLSWLLKTWETNWLLLTFLTGKDVYKPDKVKEDMEVIRKQYLNRGYLRVIVDEPKIEVVQKGKKRKLKLVYEIEEGKRYNIDAIAISGATEKEENYLKTIVKVNEREIYNAKLVDDTVEKMKDFFHNRGFIYGYVYAKKDIDDEHQLVDITFTIEKGKKMYLRRLTFTGNDVTKDKVIRREFFLQEGSVFNAELFVSSLKKLHYLGYFSENIEPNIIPVEGEEDKVDLEIKVEEQGKNQIEFGGGYSTTNKLFISGGFTTKNLLGSGMDFSINFSSGDTIKTYGLKITDPWLFDYPVYGQFEIYRRYVSYLGYKKRAQGLVLSSGRRIMRYTNLYLSYTFDRSRITDVDLAYFYDEDEKYPKPPEQNTEFFGLWIGERDTSEITLSLINDRRNAQVNASKGSKNAVYLSLAGGILQGDNKYYSMAYDSIWYVPLIKPVFLGLHGKLAYIQPYDGSILPTTNKYYLGGDYTIRGFEYRSIGPKNKRGVVIGGNKLVLFNAELTIPFSEVFRFVVFYDIGNVFREQEDIRFDDLRDSAGLEVRITIPAIYLPIRFIYAWNLHPEEDEDDSQFSFGFGTTF